MRATGLLGLMLLVLAGCGRDSPTTDPDFDAEAADARADDAATTEAGGDASPATDAREPDALPSDALPSDALPADALPSDALPADALPSDALPADALPSDGFGGDAAAPPPPCVPADEVCDGVDDDCDGEIDEGVANACGGCGPVPPSGCQAWRVDLVQDTEGTLDAHRVVALLAGVGVEVERLIDGATCTYLRLPDQPMQAHLGVVQITSRLGRLFLLPEYDARLGGHRYVAQEVLGRVAVHGAGDRVEIEAGGGGVVGRFADSIVAPAPLAGIAGVDLAGLLDAARGAAEAAAVRWRPAGLALAGTVRLFVGGSRPLFNDGTYRGIEHYQLEGVLEDDGALDLPPGFFGAGVPDSSVWVWMGRERTRRVIQGPHSVSLRAGDRVELRGNGALEGDEPPPFDLLAPDPADPRIAPGEPLIVRWGPLPDGKGPLLVALTLADGEAGETRQLSCIVDDPTTGELTLPADITAAWPVGARDLRQLNVRWTLDDEPLPAPDRGHYERAVTLLLQLVP